jgi:hypothetical protein
MLMVGQSLAGCRPGLLVVRSAYDPNVSLSLKAVCLCSLKLMRAPRGDAPAGPSGSSGGRCVDGDDSGETSSQRAPDRRLYFLSELGLAGRLCSLLGLERVWSSRGSARAGWCVAACLSCVRGLSTVNLRFGAGARVVLLVGWPQKLCCGLAPLSFQTSKTPNDCGRQRPHLPVGHLPRCAQKRTPFTITCGLNLFS